jgi:hypothetical protein
MTGPTAGSGVVASVRGSMAAVDDDEYGGDWDDDAEWK